MKIKKSLLPHIQLAVVLAFVAACVTFFGYLWVGSGGGIPLVTGKGYRVSLDIPHVSNLVRGSDVMSAGVKIGTVADVHVDGNQASVMMQLDGGPRPLHEGAAVVVRYKTLLEETFLEVTDGTGAPIADGSRLPAGSGKPAVELNDVLNSLDQPTRDALAGSIRSLGAATADGRDSISAALSGLGDAARQGKDALGALAAQSDQLQQLTGDTASLVAALDSRQGQIAQLVTDAEQLTSVTAAGKDDLTSVMRELPGLLDKARSASTGLTQLSQSLAPVAANLKTAAPDVSAALQQLPQTAADLRRLLPSLNGVLDTASPTLARVPVVASDADALIPPADVALRDVNPMLSYLAPYGHEITGFFVNFGQSLNTQNGVLKMTLVVNEQSASGLPLTTNPPLFDRNNPYPAAGSLNDPKSFSGQYPRVQQEGK
ncbi:MCE family protein [Amycolatopsis acidicola]|uniref:MCE family protein n=1 Tax=Amycolatopsis acidicola TaxID=2596893 RepID=A0A5N0VKE8_9PSEU|nr:MlaD family protein [Amycolatopsis acidicola]KAA9165983.1 MCE family protein [Amycolatopsis acidicola]